MLSILIPAFFPLLPLLFFSPLMEKKLCFRKNEGVTSERWRCAMNSNKDIPLRLFLIAIMVFLWEGKGVEGEEEKRGNLASFFLIFAG